MHVEVWNLWENCGEARVPTLSDVSVPRYNVQKSSVAYSHDSPYLIIHNLIIMLYLKRIIVNQRIQY